MDALDKSQKTGAVLKEHYHDIKVNARNNLIRVKALEARAKANGTLRTFVSGDLIIGTTYQPEESLVLKHLTEGHYVELLNKIDSGEE